MSDGMVRLVFRLAVLLVAAPEGPAAPVQEPAVYSVGAAKVDITPAFPIRLNGFGSRCDEAVAATRLQGAQRSGLGGVELRRGSLPSAPRPVDGRLPRRGERQHGLAPIRDEFEGQTAGTGGWDRYNEIRIGRVVLRKGGGRLTFRSAGPIHGALLDLRQFRLVPADRPDAPGEAAAEPADPRALAESILDDGREAEERERIIADHPKLAGRIVSAMTHDLPDDAKEEYRRIPWLWRVSVAAGRGDDAESLVELLDVSLPADGRPLRDWQAVVVGGGVVHGLSLRGAWPAERLAEILHGRDDLAKRLHLAIESASTMAGDEATPTGTRYDALRMLGIAPWNRFGRLLASYLAAGTNEELQMGAVSGLVDVPGPEAARTLIERLRDLTDSNRDLALDGLLRGEERRSMLLDAVESNLIRPDQLGDARRHALLTDEREELRDRARRLLEK